MIFLVICKEEKYIGRKYWADNLLLVFLLVSILMYFWMYFLMGVFYVSLLSFKGFSEVRHFCISLMERVKQLSFSNPTSGKFSQHQVYSYDSYYCLKLSFSQKDDLVMRLIV